MGWFTSTFSGTIGKKLIMALTGLFLCSFLIVHLVGNFQLLKNDAGEAFNQYSYFMTHNIIIKTISYVLYAGIIAHTVWAIILTFNNKKARPTGYYEAHPQANSPWNSRNMGVLGTIILIFLVVHMSNFWYKYHFHDLPQVPLEDGMMVKNLYKVVTASFGQLWYVVLYVFSMAALAFHLHHGFKSSFQTLGLSHKKYTPFIRQVGLWFSILVSLGFALIPVYMYIVQHQ